MNDDPIKPIHIFYTIYGYTLFIVFTILFIITIIPVLFVNALFKIDGDKKVFSGITRFYSYLFFNLFFVHRLNIRQSSPIEANGQKRIYVLNHASSYDSILLYTIKDPVKVVIKDTWGRTLLGVLQGLTGNIILKTGSGLLDAFSVVDVMKQKLERQIPIAIFPEGTRSRDGKIGKFYTGSFQLAIDCKAEIIPIVMDSWNTIRPGSLWIRDVKPVISYLKPLKYEDYRDLSAKALAKNVRMMMIDELLSIREYRRLNEKDYYRNGSEYKKIDNQMYDELIYNRG